MGRGGVEVGRKLGNVVPFCSILGMARPNLGPPVRSGLVLELAGFGWVVGWDGEVGRDHDGFLPRFNGEVHEDGAGTGDRAPTRLVDWFRGGIDRA